MKRHNIFKSLDSTTDEQAENSDIKGDLYPFQYLNTRR